MKKILLVDSDASIRRALGQVLASEHYTVIPAATAGEAVARFIAEQPDLILLDLNLPDRDDWDVFDSAENTHPGVPVIVITNKSYQQTQVSSLLADAVMEKPLDIPLLLKTIRRYLAGTPPESSRPENPVIFSPS